MAAQGARGGARRDGNLGAVGANFDAPRHAASGAPRQAPPCGEEEDAFFEVALSDESSDEQQGDAKEPRRKQQDPTAGRLVLKRDKYGFMLTEEAFQELKSYLDRYKYVHPARVQRWQELLGAEELGSTNSGYYESLLALEHRYQYNVLRQIRMDMTRTFPNNAFFLALNGLERLERILVAYAVRNPDVGYCQGMNYIAGFLLVMLEEEDAARSQEAFQTPLTAAQKEERVFWMLVCIVERKMYNRGYYLRKSEMFALKMDCLVLKRLTQQLQPLVYRRISEFPKCPIFMVLSASWFITLFIDSLPSEALIKVWDAYALEGRVVLFRVAIAILRLCEDAVLGASDVNIVAVVRSRTRTFYNCAELMDTAFSQELVAAITADGIAETKRAIYSEMVHAYERSIGWWEYCVSGRLARGVSGDAPAPAAHEYLSRALDDHDAQPAAAAPGPPASLAKQCALM
eukprot:TRINITY_DN11911_c0_g1_i1.p1 TRINITY_DN11911_c0_g1~~TRINITY_DN11911_c0_g1_i1.p1  ORF type:complete len:496 (+),score=217.44 TRINITY_DN11911_c0_g1_i1:112-1488(+)